VPGPDQEDSSAAVILDDAVSLIDTHIHTVYSDGTATVREVEDICLDQGIGGCITDHNEIRGSLALYDRGRIPTLPAIELGSRERIELMLFFRRPEACENFFLAHVEPYRKKRWYTFLPRSLDHLVNAAREHDVLISVPHPYAPLWKNIESGKRRSGAVLRVLNRADGIEVLNGALTRRANRRAWYLCRRLRKVPLAGSDSHDLETVGSVVVAFDRAVNSVNLFDCLKKHQICSLFGPWHRPRYMANTWQGVKRHTLKFITP